MTFTSFLTKQFYTDKYFIFCYICLRTLQPWIPLLCCYQKPTNTQIEVSPHRASNMETVSFTLMPASNPQQISILHCKGLNTHEENSQQLLLDHNWAKRDGFFFMWKTEQTKLLSCLLFISSNSFFKELKECFLFAVDHKILWKPSKEKEESQKGFQCV